MSITISASSFPHNFVCLIGTPQGGSFPSTLPRFGSTHPLRSLLFPITVRRFLIANYNMSSDKITIQINFEFKSVPRKKSPLRIGDQQLRCDSVCIMSAFSHSESRRANKSKNESLATTTPGQLLLCTMGTTCFRRSHCTVTDLAGGRAVQLCIQMDDTSSHRPNMRTAVQFFFRLHSQKHATSSTTGGQSSIWPADVNSNRP